jgi:hypothetical protein
LRTTLGVTTLSPLSAALEAIFDAVRPHGPSPSHRRSATAVLALVRRESGGLQPALQELLRVHSDSDVRERSIRMMEKVFPAASIGRG